MSAKVEIVNKTRSVIPALPFARIKDDILGRDYDLSVAFVGPSLSCKINLERRGKDKPTNILSFALSENSGELILCPSVVRKESAAFGKSSDDFLGFLVIHGMLHLKGMRHGSIMERAEQKYDKKYFSGHRRGHHRGSGRGGRIRKRRQKS